MRSTEQVAEFLTDRGEPHVLDGDVVKLRAVPMEFVAGADQEALRCQLTVTSSVSLTRMVDIVFAMSVDAGADVHLVGTGAVGRAVLWMRLADEQDRLRIAESLRRAAHSSHRDEILRRLWGVLAAARQGHDDRWDAAQERIVEMVEVGDGISLDEAAWHAEDPKPGDEIAVPVRGLLHCLAWRWLSEAYPGIAEAEHTLH
jgi:hypothetical protein